MARDDVKLSLDETIGKAVREVLAKMPRDTYPATRLLYVWLTVNADPEHYAASGELRNAAPFKRIHRALGISRAMLYKAFDELGQLGLVSTVERPVEPVRIHTELDLERQISRRCSDAERE